MVKQTHPMENIFIQQIELLVAQMFRGESFDPPLEQQLQNHLERARKLGALRYEGETLNTLASLVFSKRDLSLHYRKQALACAEKAEDIVLQTKVLNNLGTHYYRIYQFDESLATYRRCVALASQQDPLPLAYLIGSCGKVSLLLVKGAFEDALQTISTVRDKADKIHVTSVTRNNYGRAIWVMNNTAALTYIANGDAEQADATIRMASHLSQQLNEDEFNFVGFLTGAFHAFAFEQQSERFIETVLAADEQDAFEIYIINVALILHHMGHHTPARHLATAMLSRCEAKLDPAVFANVQQLLAPVLAPAP